jgi:hypothetical protein
MKILYEISSFPDDPSGYKSVTETNGNFSIVIDDKVFVRIEDALLLEFAYFVHSWIFQINYDADSNFYYKSMDEEEEPIFALELLQDGCYRAISCWSEMNARELNLEEIKIGFDLFLSSLRNNILQRYSFIIDDAFRLFAATAKS